MHSGSGSILSSIEPPHFVRHSGMQSFMAIYSSNASGEWVFMQVTKQKIESGEAFSQLSVKQDIRSEHVPSP